MGAADLLAVLQAAGLTVVADDDRLVVAPAERLTDALRDLIRAAKPALMAALTDSQDAVGRGPTSARWLLHLPDADPLAVSFNSPATHDEVLTRYSGALAAEPVSEPLLVELPAAISKQFEECATAGLYGDDDRPILQAMHAADAAGTSKLIESVHARIGRCHQCRCFIRPGLSDGYCGARLDLEPAYGPRHPLRVLPIDGGAKCTAWIER